MGCYRIIWVMNTIGYYRILMNTRIYGILYDDIGCYMNAMIL